MSQYVDGYLIPIEKKNLKIYKKMARLGCKMWMKHGALGYYETVGDDLNVKWGFPFPKLLKLKASETVVFAFVIYKNKTHRNKVMKAVMSDPKMRMDLKMPFDMKRFSVGGFKVLVKN
ncbi:MAG: DUF1428 domain-containing protein [Bacteriovoracaceae bacterium]